MITKTKIEQLQEDELRFILNELVNTEIDLSLLRSHPVSKTEREKFVLSFLPMEGTKKWLDLYFPNDNKIYL